MVWEGVYKLEAEGDLERAARIVYQHFDALFLEGMFDAADLLLAEINYEQITDSTLVTLLTVTGAAEERLSNRPYVVAQLLQRLRKTYTEQEIQDTMQGLL